MARTTANMRVPDTVFGPRSNTPYPHRADACEFCISLTTSGVRHDFCPGEIHTTAPGKRDDKVWTCQCWKEGHPV